jgi:hypothetical protein
LAPVNAELEQAVADRSATSAELDSVFSSGSSESSSDDVSPSSSNSVRSSFMFLNPVFMNSQAA